VVNEKKTNQNESKEAETWRFMGAIKKRNKGEEETSKSSLTQKRRGKKKGKKKRTELHTDA